MKNYTITLEDYWNYNKLSGSHPFIRAAPAHCLNTEQDKLYLFGGFNSEFKASSELFVINTNDLCIETQISLNIEERINSEMYYWNNSIIIIGGASFDYSKPIKLFKEIVIIELPDYRIKRIELEDAGLRFAGFFDYKKGCLYYTGGLDKDGTIFKVNIMTEKIEKIKFDEKIYFSRCGATAKSYGEKAILFSGFRNVNNIPKCYSDYYIYNFGGETIRWKECNEFVGRTFSKAVLIEKYNAILFVFGTYNGMEGSRSIILYDYKKDIFDDLHIQDIPVAITEGIVFYLEKRNKIYIAGGVSEDKVQDIIWELDIEKIMEMRIKSENRA
jgi:hypothetical protein